MTLKICHVISGDLWAGAEVMAFHLLTGLSKLPEIDLFVILMNKGRLASELQNAGIRTCVLDESKRSFFEIVRVTAKTVRMMEPHILHSHRYKENVLSYVVSLTLKRKASLVSTQHGLPELYGGKPNLLQRLKSRANFWLLATRFDKVVAVSADIGEAIARDYSVRAGDIEVIRNGIVIPESRDRAREKDGFVIGSAGRFVPVKDYLLMVEVAKEVNEKSDNIRFELAGDGPMLGNIQRRIRECGLEQCFMLRGFLNDVSVFYDGLDVYLNTSLHEGIPMSVLEAMAHGVPSVAPRVGGFGEIVTDEVDGYLVDGRNPRDFAERCLSLYNNKPLQRSMAGAAREKIVGQFAIDRMVNAYLDLYMRAVESRGQRKH